ncbi:hypothetical protein VNI00_018661 [Paramarasmius palmivorus]|uniref:Uncharacterized protein n=1 Tax=Paramarasmius palmivorus TaxID=297713 RepID=A0AAW0ATY8_9AGAR
MARTKKVESPSPKRSSPIKKYARMTTGGKAPRKPMASVLRELEDIVLQPPQNAEDRLQKKRTKLVKKGNQENELVYPPPRPGTRRSERLRFAKSAEKGEASQGNVQSGTPNGQRDEDRMQVDGEEETQMDI